jgi:branched-chain amino acid aminotransferase
MLNVDGQVTEGSGDNIFFIKKGTLYTPPCEAGALEGITRRFVLDTLAPACKIPVKIRNFGIDELLEADEVFMTGSAAEIIAVREVLKHFDGELTETVRISEGEGPLTGKMRAEFRRIVTSDHVPED